MSNEWKQGPNSQQQAINMAQTSKTLFPNGNADTTSWSATAKETYYGNGGK